MRRLARVPHRSTPSPPSAGLHMQAAEAALRQQQQRAPYQPRPPAMQRQSSGSRPRATSPSGEDTSPRKKAKSLYTSSGTSSPLPVCSICLGRHQHDVGSCSPELLWDGRTPTYAKRGTRRLIVVKTSGALICASWQRPPGCSERAHNARHVCSGCGSSQHGAHWCPLAQDPLSGDAV